ncbi:MAG: hypothetical protein ACKOSS_08945, partial [Planctomycetia bacterium]
AQVALGQPAEALGALRQALAEALDIGLGATLASAERQRLETLREKNLDGDPLTAAERRDLLELERRARLNAPGQPR